MTLINSFEKIMPSQFLDQIFVTGIHPSLSLYVVATGWVTGPARRVLVSTVNSCIFFLGLRCNP